MLFARKMIHMIPPERNCLGKGQNLALLESHTKIDMHHFSSTLINEDVTQVSVTETQNITRNRRGGDAACICESPLDPGLGRSILLLEEMMERWPHTFAALKKNFQSHLDRPKGNGR